MISSVPLNRWKTSPQKLIQRSNALCSLCGRKSFTLLRARKIPTMSDEWFKVEIIKIVNVSSFGFSQTDNETQQFIERFAKSIWLNCETSLFSRTTYFTGITSSNFSLHWRSGYLWLQLEFWRKSLRATVTHFAAEFRRLFFFFDCDCTVDRKSAICVKRFADCKSISFPESARNGQRGWYVPHVWRQMLHWLYLFRTVSLDKGNADSGTRLTSQSSRSATLTKPANAYIYIDETIGVE